MSGQIPSSYEDIFVIGDIHGCLTELEQLVALLPFNTKKLLVFLGDYIDRGTRSAEVVHYIIELKKKFNVVTLMGNHEAMLLDFLKKPRSSAAAQFIFNGGGATLASYGDGRGNFQIPEEHLEFYQNLLPYYEIENYFMVHGGVPEVPLHKISMKKHGLYLLWAREPFLSSEYDWGKVIVHGHTPSSQVQFTENKINVDTGCVYKNKLSAVSLKSLDVYEVEKQEESIPTVLHDESSSRRGVRFQGVIPLTILWENYKYVMETLDYNEFGVYVKDITGGKKIPTKEQVIVKIQTTPFQEVAYHAVVVRIEKTVLSTCYAIKFLAEA